MLDCDFLVESHKDGNGEYLDARYPNVNILSRTKLILVHRLRLEVLTINASGSADLQVCKRMF